MSIAYVSVLMDTDGTIWGVYNSDVFLSSICSMICKLKPSIDLVIKEIFINTNEVKSQYTWDSVTQKKIKMGGGEEDGKEVLKTSKVIAKEVKKIEAMYETFLSFQESLKKSPKQIPSFLNVQKAIFDSIEEKQIPCEEQFSYFMENYFHYKIDENKIK